MTKQRRVFSAEFKREAADLVLKQNYSLIEASRSLGIGESALRRWVSQLLQERTGVTPQSKALTPEQQKIQELEARIARLEREKLILKKAGPVHPDQEPGGQRNSLYPGGWPGRLKCRASGAWCTHRD